MNTRPGREYTKIKLVTFMGQWRILFFVNSLCFHTELCAFLMLLGRVRVRLLHGHSQAACWCQEASGQEKETVLGTRKLPGKRKGRGGTAWVETILKV